MRTSKLLVTLVYQLYLKLYKFNFKNPLIPVVSRGLLINIQIDTVHVPKGELVYGTAIIER